MMGRSLVLLLCVAGCGGGGTSALLDGAAPTDAAIDTGPVRVDTGSRFMEACKVFNRRCEGAAAGSPDCGSCQHRTWYRADVCSATAPCPDLLLYWAAFDCDQPELVATVAALQIAYPDVVVACAQPIYPGEILPASLGAPERDDAVIADLFAHLRPGGELGVWSGANLLMAGCSMGATRYPVVAARYPDDARWVGATKTAACFSEGVVDLSTQDRFVGEHTGPTCDARHRRIAHAYTRELPVDGHACDSSALGQCACDPAHAALTYGGDCADGDCVAFDSIVRTSSAGVTFAPGVTADDLAIRHWKLVTEGGGPAIEPARRCELDVVDGAPFAGLCGLLDDDPDHDCVHEDFPGASHCAYFNSHLGELCLDWFRGL